MLHTRSAALTNTYLTQCAKPFDSLTEPASHAHCGHVNSLTSAGALRGAHGVKKVMAWQGRMLLANSVTQPCLTHTTEQQLSQY